MLSKLYATVVARRRAWYKQHQDSCRRLTRPVVSIGALSVGGRGKTPVTALIAQLLYAAGERPSILSRGYGRQDRIDGVVIVRDYKEVHATIATAGDEPLMLAERLTGVCVLVSEDRYAAGCYAETHLNATVHILDDGFQHFQLARDVDLLLTHADDVDQQTLPFGRLRESPETARVADAVVVDVADLAGAQAVARSLGVTKKVFRMERTLTAPRPLPYSGVAVPIGVGTRVLAVSGIAEPVHFRETLTAAGFDVVAMFPFKDHHRFTSEDVSRIATRAAGDNISWVLTTEKDAVRLAPYAPFSFPIAVVPLTVCIEPVEDFSAWLLSRLDRNGDSQ